MQDEILTKFYENHFTLRSLAQYKSDIEEMKKNAST